jgi:hypothetical protein
MAMVRTMADMRVTGASGADMAAGVVDGTMVGDAAAGTIPGPGTGSRDTSLAGLVASVGTASAVHMVLVAGTASLATVGVDMVGAADMGADTLR